MPTPPQRRRAADAYRSLPRSARLLAQIYGAVSPYALTIPQIRALLTHAGIGNTDRAFGRTDVMLLNAAIVKAGIGVRATGSAAVRAAPEWAVGLTARAHAEGLLTKLHGAMRYAVHYDEDHEPPMKFRWAAILGDRAALNAMRAGNRRPYDPWRAFAEPPAVATIEKLPDPHREDALEGCLRETIDRAAPPAPIVDACFRLSARPETHAAEIAFAYVLGGRFEDAEAVFSALPADRANGKTAAAGLASARAMIATLRGDDRAALAFIDDAVKEERGGTRKKILFPDSRAFVFSLLSLARIDTPEAGAKIRRFMKYANRLRVDRVAELNLVDAIRFLRAGREFRGPLGGESWIEAMVDGLALLQAEANVQPRDRDAWRARMERCARRAAENGYRWVAAECAALTGKVCGGETGAAGLPDPDALHTALGTQSLFGNVIPADPWERSLKELEQLAFEVGRKKPRKRAAAPVEKRLVWQVLDYEHDIAVAVREQRRTRGGGWSKGRKVALRRLAEQAHKMEHLTDADRAAAAAIRRHETWNRTEYRIGPGGLYALAGHPHVFDAAGGPIDIVRVEPELRVDEEPGDSVRVTLQPYPWGADYSWMIGAGVGDRIEITRFTADQMRIARLVPEHGLTLPASARARLLEAISDLASSVRVQSAAGEAESATAVEADPEPWIRMEPFQTGLKASLLVEPIPDSGQFHEPGKGGSTVFASLNGVSFQARRDLEAERAGVDRLVERCPPLASRPTEYAPLEIPDPMHCLELLEMIDAAGARCKWPRGEPFRIAARHSTPSLSLSVRTADQWLDASGTLAVDDRTVLDLKRLLDLLDASPRSRFVKLDDGRFLALSAALRQQLDSLASLSAPAAGGAVRVHALAASPLGDLFADAALDADGGWRDLNERIETSLEWEPPLPGTLQAELRPYQVEGYRWLARLSRLGAGACLADDMGLGKTVQSLAVLLQRAPDGPALVVAPTSVVANWTDEARRFAPTLNVRVYGGAAARRAELLDGPAPFDLFVTSYGLLQNDAERLAAVPWHTAVLDEAQAIKNPATKRARAARRLSADFRVVTTGTPIQNNLSDLHSLFGFLNPGLLGSRRKFRQRFAEPVERDGDEHARARLRGIIAPFVLRRLKSDVLDDLPERTEVTIRVPLSGAEAAMYEALRQRAVEELEAARLGAPSAADGERFQVFAHLTRLRLACCHPRLATRSFNEGESGALAGATAESEPEAVVETMADSDGQPMAASPGSSKLETFAAILGELRSGGHRVLVFSQFVKHLKLIEEYLRARHIEYQYLDGGTTAKARRKRIRAFQSGEGEVFLISLKAGGTGINLTAADYVIHMDPWWNPAVEDQASDRAHRIGQTRPVTIYRLVAEGTIEEQIVDLHHHKRELADRLLEGADATAKLSTDELLDLIRQPLRDAWPRTGA